MLKTVARAMAMYFVGATMLAAADPASPAADPAALQEMFQKLGQPGPQHEQLKTLVGKWDCVGRNFDNPAQPIEWKGSAEFTSLMGGRYIQQDFRGEAAGMKFEGRGITGYDNAQQKYVGVWIDSMSTGLLLTEGTHDEATATTTETGVTETPIGDLKMRMVTQHKSGDEFLFTMYMTMPDGERKMMEIEYRRRK